MGERSNRIFNVGCPRIDTVRKALKSYTRKNLLKTINKVGVGDKVKVNEDIIVLSQHPVTSEFEASTKNYEKTVNAILKLKNNNIKIVWLWPNSDAGSDEISGFIRKFREKKLKTNIRFITNISQDKYFQLLNESVCIVGNSSSAIREGAFIGVPAVNIGTRQKTRIRGKNVIDVNYDEAEIYRAIKLQLNKKPYKSSNLYGNGKSAQKIIKILKKIKKVDTQKLNRY